jgi:lysyl-tRNA synthetase class 2
MHTEDTNALIEQRKAKLAALRARGIDPFANKFTPSIGCGEARSKFQDGSLAEGAPVAVAGRIVAHRDMGKSQFLDIKDYTGRVQVYAQKNVLGDSQFDVFKHMDLGDFIGVKGTMFRTRTGEPSVRVESFVVLSKALRPPPGQWYGLAEPETRYRQRYLDLLVNDDVAHVFRQRSRIISAIRSFLESRGFIEVETPVMQAVAGGAAAKPFVTHHNALDCDFYLRISLELYLKRLLVGGFDRVFEIGRNFRNEGISRKHNPEFTMLEAYQAYGDYETMMELVESMVCHVAREVVGSLLIKHVDKEGRVVRQIDLTPPWRRVKYKELVRQRAGADWFEIGPEQRRQRAIELGADIEHCTEDYEVTQAVFEKLIEPTLIDPTFVTHVPKELIPLAKLSPDDPTTVEVFECCINGQEIAPAYTEQNDPVAQRERLEQQAGQERQKIDEDFLVALEHGMPPAGGMGMGIDRLCMMLLGQESIRDVILFPQLRPKQLSAEQP